MDDDSVGRVIDTLLGNALSVVDELRFASPRRPRRRAAVSVGAVAYEPSALAVNSHRPFKA